MATISVIVPVYNVEKYLSRCIDSILAQTFTDFELILVDDSSPDRCGEICDEYMKKDKRVRVIHKENGGVSSARNAGLDVCNGQYVTFVDSDDYIGPDWLNALYQEIIKRNADVVSADFTLVSDNGETLKAFHYKKNNFCISNEKELIDFLLNAILGGQLGWAVWTRLFRAEIIQNQKIRFCETCENYAEDLFFTLEYMLYVKRVTTCESFSYYYVKHSGSMMNKSLEVVRFHATNEVSRQFGKHFFSLFHSAYAKRAYPVIHYNIMSPEYNKILRLRREKEWNKEIRKIKYKRWFYRNTLSAPLSYHLFCKYRGKSGAREALIFSGCCIPGIPYLYSFIHRIRHPESN